MAMNRREQEQMEILERALALSWPRYEEPEPMTKEEMKAATQSELEGSTYNRKGVLGWFFNEHTGKVSAGWSNGFNHSSRSRTGETATRGMGKMYRTQLEAARALRWAVTRRYASILRNVDILCIEAEQSESQE